MKKSIPLFLLITLYPAGLTAQSPVSLNVPAGNIVFHTVISGATMGAVWSDELSVTLIWVVRDDFRATNRAATALMSYAGSFSDPTSQVCMPDPILGTYCHYTRTTYDLGYGEIPADDVQISAATGRVNTDINNDPDFILNRCVVDEIAGTTICNVVPPSGIISLQWSKTSESVSRSQGVSESRVGPELITSGGTCAQSSARVTGTTLGGTAQGAPGNLGTCEGSTIDIIRAQ